MIEPVEQYVNQLKSNEADDFGGQLQASLRTFDDVDKVFEGAMFLDIN